MHRQEVVDMKEKKRPHINSKTCAGCSVCVENCPMDCLKLTEPRYHGDIRTNAHLALRDQCIGCGICARVCPIEAITMSEK